MNQPLDRRALLVGGAGLASSLLVGCATESPRGVVGAAAPGSGSPASDAGRATGGSVTTQATATSSSAPATSASTGTGSGDVRPSSTGTPAPTSTGARPTGTRSTAAKPGQAARANVPVLCWHEVREQRASDSQKSSYELVCPPANFVSQLDALRRGGWTTITPDEYRSHITTGAELPDKPVLLTFDDGSDSQAQRALPLVLEREMKAALFIMTVVIDKKHWITSDEVRALARAGVVIGSHTWDHQNVAKLDPAKYEPQFAGSRRTLQKLSGQPVTSFCYPGGHWGERALPALADAGYTTAFQLRETPVSPANPTLTLRRQIVVSEWTGKQLLAKLDSMVSKGV